MATHKTKKVMLTGILTDNPVIRQILGICSALAVTNLMLNSLIMGIALTLVTAFSSLIISAIRTWVPKHIRMIVQTFIIASLVIVVDVLLKAYYNPMSQMLGPYVGLIITNCIIMGRAEAFAQNNPPLLSFMDGLANGIGYTIVLLMISFVRELLGFGSVFGINLLGANWTAWTLMIMPPGAFFMLGILIWINNSRKAEGGAK
ncbi:MAG: NADH:ubiquinone reductase (Na(+)-transporting) subunit D [Tissierellia bacterium]|jgi:Na+-transporting NADH:ubiquinone oxidoreductase subunit D|nr:NADH:ubiquinone reductase (Na(+)-transporting) subunit D [Tissierellia bacterium]